MEHSIIRVTINVKNYIIINVYLPPYPKRLSLVNKLERIIESIIASYPNDIIFFTEDLNMSNTEWDHINEEVLVMNDMNLHDYEEQFHALCFKYGLRQINNFTNSRGKYLDLVLTSNESHITVFNPINSNLLDSLSIHHNAIETIIETFILPKQKQIRPITYKLNFKKISKQLATMVLPLSGNLNLIPGVLSSEIVKFTDDIKLIQIANTTSRTITRPNALHPWLRSKKYFTLYRTKKLQKIMGKYYISIQ